MIKLSDFGFEDSLKNPSEAFGNTWSSKSFINGEAVDTFEKQFTKYCDADDGVAVSSCTSALQLSLLALGIGPGDDVITVPYTWISTAECIKQVGANPVFVDIRSDDLCIDVEAIKNKITPNTKAIIPVDLFGNVADIDSLKSFGLPVIQDAAQSTGATYKDRKVGGIADLTCFSFYPTKNLGSWGDAGFVSGDKSLVSKVRQLRNHGQSEKFKVNSVGWNARMDSIQAEVLLHKLPLLDSHNMRRREIAQRYNNELSKHVTVPFENQHSTHVYHQYVIHSQQVGKIQAVLADKEIQSRRYYPTIISNMEPYHTEESFPNSLYSSQYGLAIPVHQYLTDDQVYVIIKVIKDTL